MLKSYHKDNLRARGLILACGSRLSPSLWNVKAAGACRDYSGYTSQEAESEQCKLASNSPRAASSRLGNGPTHRFPHLSKTTTKTILTGMPRAPLSGDSRFCHFVSWHSPPQYARFPGVLPLKHRRRRDRAAALRENSPALVGFCFPLLGNRISSDWSLFTTSFE